MKQILATTTIRINTNSVLFIWMAIFVGLAFSTTVTAQEVVIEGAVQLEAVASQPVQPSVGGYQTSAPGGSQQADASSDDIIIWIESRNAGAPIEVPPADSIQVLDQVNKRFQPRLMAVRAGKQVRIINSDPVYHNVFSLSKTRRFDVGRRSPDDYQEVRFPNPGVVDVFCDIHSNMHAVIRVLPQQTVAWQKLDSSGSFRFTNIPAGSYSIHFFALGNRRAQLNIEATDKDQKITLQTIRLGRQ